MCGDPEMLRVLEKSSFWLADGTFKIAPKMFYQLYSIHVSISGVAPACIYAFLPNKTEKTYNSFLQALIDLGPNCRTEKFVSSGHNITKKKKYRVLNERVQNIMSVYEDNTDFFFFGALYSLC